MFMFEQGQIEKLFKCCRCQERISNSPKLLPCTGTICEQCELLLIDRNEKYECEFCKDTHLIPKDGLKINTWIERFIKMQPVEVKRGKMFEDLEREINETKNKLKSFENNVELGHDFIKTHCLNIRNKIQLTVEKTLEKVKQIGNEFNQDLDEYEQKLNENFRNKKDGIEPIKNSIKEIESRIDKLETILLDPKTSESQLTPLTIDSKDLSTEVKNKIKEFENICFDGRELMFRAENELKNSDLGVLRVKPIMDCLPWYTGREFVAHSKKHVNAILSLPNGYLATGSSDGEIKIWDLKDYSRPLATLTSDMDSISFLGLLKDGDLVSSSDDGMINRWNLQNYSLKRSFSIESGVSRFLVLKNDYLVICGDELLTIYDLENDLVVEEIDCSTPTCCLILTKNGDFVSYGEDEMLKIWNGTDYSLKATIYDNLGIVKCMFVLPNGYLATGCYDGLIKIWDLVDNKLVKILYGHSDEVNSLCTLKDKYLLSASEDKTIKVWDLERFLLFNTEYYYNNASNIAEVFISDSKSFVSTNGGNCYLWSSDKSYLRWFFN